MSAGGPIVGRPRKISDHTICAHAMLAKASSSRPAVS
ncbi:MAG: hypothetical protein ACLU3I_19940 [Acutalibacteraceae bacterium]